MKSFTIPNYFKSPLIAKLKSERSKNDRYKNDFSPTIVQRGNVQFLIARHFGLCFGVENAIDIAYRAVMENPKKRVFLLSEMIHNKRVNSDLYKMGVRFIRDTRGQPLFGLENIQREDIVIIPAFGSTLKDEQTLRSIGVKIYNTTCPFVTRVWNRIRKLQRLGFTTIVHGKAYHEETKATFSRACLEHPAMVIQSRDEVKMIASYIRNQMSDQEFLSRFSKQCSQGFLPKKHLVKIGLVNQTTMLADETRLFSRYLRRQMQYRYGRENIELHFYSGKDTLCYATNENQRSSKELLKSKADVAIVVGGYNSSNTSHLYHVLQQKITTYYISSAHEIKSKNEIHHLLIPEKKIHQTKNWLPNKSKLTILLSAGASSPDVLVEEIIIKISNFFK